jgi:hypothetical protein
MADININKFRTSVVREGSRPASAGFVESEGQDPVDPAGSTQNHLPVTIAPAADGLSITDSQVLGGAGTTAQYIRGDASLATFPSLTGFVPYTGATADVNLGTHDLTAERGTFENNGSSDTLTVNHTSGSGYGIEVNKGGNNEALYVNKTSGSGNAMAVVGGRTALVDLSLSSVSNATGNFLTISGGVVHQRTPSETRSDVGAQAQLNGTGFVKASGTTITYDNSTYQVTSEKAQPNGYASLDSNGKVPLAQINDALIGNVNFQGLWNAATNTPTLANPPASGTKGYYYIVSTAGTFAGISFEVGDWIISSGSAWQKIDNTDAVSSVFGRTGNVVASNGDYTTAQVTESGNLYYTDGRARGALSFVAGSGAYNSSTGVITIPTNNNQITNGAGYITSAALSGYLPLTGGTLTGPLGGTSISLSGNLQLGTIGAGSSTATPNSINLTSTFSNTAGSNLKLILFDSTVGDIYGLGISSLQMDFRVPSGARYRFFNGTVTINNLAGSGTRMVVADSNGLLSTQAIPLGTVTSVTASSPLFSSGGTTPNITIQQASGSQNGFLSSTDWTTFNNKQNALTNPVTGTGTSGEVAYFTGSTTISSESKLFWDSTNDRLGIGLPNPSQPLEVSKSQNADSVIQVTNVNSGVSATAQFFANNGTTKTQFFHTGTSYATLGVLEANLGGIYNETSAGIALVAAGASGILRFATGGTTARLTISSTGAATFSSSVTVGASTNGRLGVRGFTNDSSAFAFEATNSSGNTLFIVRNDAISTFTGRLGIGTFAPQKPLEALSNANDFVSVGANNIGVGQWTGIHFGYREDNTAYRKSAIVFERTDLTSGNAQGKIHILNGPQSGTGSATLADARLTIAENGNVGIGTASPGRLLSLNATIPVLQLVNPTTGTTADDGLLIYQNGLNSIIENQEAGYLGFLTSASERMRITSGGNVLIGTTTDNGAKLSIAGGMTFIYTGQSGGSTAAYTSFNSLTFNDDFSNAANGPNKIITYGRGSTWVGGIGIHDDTQAYYAGGTHKWYRYNGTTATLNLSLDGSGNLIATGSVTATSFFESSDATIKTLVKDDYQAKGIESVVAKLYIKNGKQELGYYAQDLEGVLPSAVSKGSNGLLNLSYREVHTAKIAYLEQRIKQLENKA